MILFFYLPENSMVIEVSLCKDEPREPPSPLGPDPFAAAHQYISVQSYCAELYDNQSLKLTSDTLKNFEGRGRGKDRLSGMLVCVVCGDTSSGKHYGWLKT